MVGERVGMAAERCKSQYFRMKKDLYQNDPTNPEIFSFKKRISLLFSRLDYEVSPPTVDRLFSDLWQKFLVKIEPYPGVESVLKTARAREMSIAIVSNGTREQQTSKLQALGLLGMANVEVFSEDVGTNKPELPIFRRTIRELILPPGECLMVGDHCRVDVKGGNRAGMITCWLKMGAHSNIEPEGKEDIPDFTIHQIANLTGVFQALQS